MREVIYWHGSHVQVLVMLVFLLNIWRTKTCSGISLRSQIFYALIFTIRQLDLGQRYTLSVEGLIIKVAYILITYGTVLSMIRFYRQTYEKQYDTARTGLWIVCCIVISLFVNERFDFLEVLTALSIYLEAIAMIPQFHFIIKSQRIDKHVISYIVGMATYDLAQTIYWICQYPFSWPTDKNYWKAAGALQFVLYLDFFRKIHPLMYAQVDSYRRAIDYCKCFRKCYSFLCDYEDEDQQQVTEVHAENDPPKTGYLASNFGATVLTPSNLAEVHVDKGKLLTTD